MQHALIVLHPFLGVIALMDVNSRQISGYDYLFDKLIHCHLMYRATCNWDIPFLAESGDAPGALVPRQNNFAHASPDKTHTQVLYRTNKSVLHVCDAVVC